MEKIKQLSYYLFFTKSPIRHLEYNCFSIYYLDAENANDSKIYLKQSNKYKEFDLRYFDKIVIQSNDLMFEFWKAIFKDTEKPILQVKSEEELLKNLNKNTLVVLESYSCGKFIDKIYKKKDDLNLSIYFTKVHEELLYDLFEKDNPNSIWEDLLCINALELSTFYMNKCLNEVMEITNRLNNLENLQEYVYNKFNQPKININWK